MIGLYIHIPYCRTVCPYCDFVKRRISGTVPEAFIDALCGEIGAFEGPHNADAVFFGGGTPSLLAPGALERVMEAVRARFTLHDPEITLEANPDDVTPALADAWRSAGVNRVSLGVQSFDDATLRYLGRRHDAARAVAACETVALRFDNWSMDLIFAARADDAFERTLERCAALAPKHVSAYGLTYEPGTPFGKRADEAVDEDTYLRAFWRVEEALQGFERYEISNFARAGYRCRHNLIYWHNREYAGFGPGAYGFIDGVRARNHAKLDAYLADPGGKEEALRLSEAEIRLETVIQHLRLKDGLDVAEYARRFGRSLRTDFGNVLEELALRGLIEADGDRFRPSRLGFQLNNEIGLALVGAA